MARETKVGLIVGLGVILFVSVFVSDYISSPSPEEAFADTDLADFHQQTTNQTQLLVRPGNDLPAELSTTDLAAVSLEQIERRYGPPPAPRDPHTLVEPPFRDAPPSLVGPGEETTPIAIDPNTPRPPIGVGRIDDSGYATEHQLDNRRIGLARGIDDTIVHVQIPDPPVINHQPQQVRHEVKAGENLTTIARKHYDGDGNMWRSIRDANPNKVGTNGEVVQGVVLIIPKRSTETTDPAAELTRDTPNSERPSRTRVRIVKVKEGQTLSEIAYEHLGAGNKWRDIMAVNPELKKPEHLRAGMKLRIPAEDTSRQIDAAENAMRGQPQPETTRTAEASTYTVQAGDSLYRIAQRKLGNGERYREIYEANRDKLRSADDVKVGMKLKLPAR